MSESEFRWLQDLGAEFARVAAERERPARRTSTARPRRVIGPSGGRRALALALSGLAILSTGAYAVPVTRAAIDDVAGSFAGWISGDDAPTTGRALRPEDDAPEWVSTGQGRVLAEAEGVRLFVSRDDSPSGTLLQFTLGDGSVHFDTPKGWAERFSDRAVLVLGGSPMPDATRSGDAGRTALLGVSARSVAKLELRYASGAPLISEVSDGGFVLIADTTRPWRELIAYDADGQELDRANVAPFGPPAGTATP